MADIKSRIRGVYESPSAPERAPAVGHGMASEDPAFWQQRGRRRVASRNLWISSRV